MSTITEILWTDNITDSRAVINTNFSNLNTDKLEASDIANFETTTQLNARDTANRNRANHTWTQTASTISDFDTEVSNNTDVSANTSARHTHSNKTILDNTTASFTTAQETKLSNTSWINTWDNATNTQYSWLATSKQDTLVSGTNIKTVNSQSLLWSWDITITWTWHTIQDEWTPLTTRANLNFVWAWVTVTDDAWNNATKVTITSWWWNVTTSDTLTNNTVLLWNWTTDIKTSAKTIVTTLWTDDTTLPTSKAVKDVTDAKANLSWATFTWSISATNLSWTNSWNETATSIWTLIWLSWDATPNDTDFIATSLTDWWILKKLTWTNAKAFLKTYFDTLYAPIWIVWDMVLSSIQSVTWLKIFDKEKLAMKWTSTWVTTFSTTNTSANNYTQSFQSKTWTVANMSDTMYIWTTWVTLNRASNPLTLAWITLTTPDIWTPSAWVLTNCTWLPEWWLSTTDVTTNDVSTSKHWFAPKAPNDTTKFLRWDWTWGTPSWWNSYWTLIPWTPTRTANTTFTVTWDYTWLLKKWLIIKWTESSAIKCWMIISSSYSDPNTTVTIVWDTMASIDASSAKYTFESPFVMKFATAWWIWATWTDVMNWDTCIVFQDMRVIWADMTVWTVASTSWNTVIDINKNWTTMFASKPTLAYNARYTTSTKTADNWSAITLWDEITIDIDTVTSTTYPVDLYVYLFTFPTFKLSLT